MPIVLIIAYHTTSLGRPAFEYSQPDGWTHHWLAAYLAGGMCWLDAALAPNPFWDSQDRSAVADVDSVATANAVAIVVLNRVSSRTPLVAPPLKMAAEHY